MSGINYEELCKTIKDNLSDEHQVEIKQEKGYLLVVSVYTKRKVVYKQKIEE